MSTLDISPLHWSRFRDELPVDTGQTDEDGEGEAEDGYCERAGGKVLAARIVTEGPHYSCGRPGGQEEEHEAGHQHPELLRPVVRGIQVGLVPGSESWCRHRRG